MRKIKMSQKIKIVLLAILNDRPTRSGGLIDAVEQGFLVYEDTYTKYGDVWGRGYVFTPLGIAALQQN